MSVGYYITRRGFRAWKVATSADSPGRIGRIVELWIPAGAHIIATYRGGRVDTSLKARASEAIVVAIYSAKTGKRIKTARRASSMWDLNFTYRVGQMIRPALPFDTSATPCASGIHFYRNLRLAQVFGPYFYGLGHLPQAVRRCLAKQAGTRKPAIAAKLGK